MRRKSYLIIVMLAVAWQVGQAGEEVLFSEDFESPDVTAAQSDGYTSGAVPTGWIGASNGYGAGRRGLVDEAHGDFTDPTGEQAFAFRYTNSGVTTDEGVIGSYVLDTEYTVTFDVVMDGHNNATPYTAGLLLFDEGASRITCIGLDDDAFALLKQVSGNATTNGAYETVSFTYTPTNAAYVGKDLAVRFKGATSTAIIDNFQFTWIAPPPAGTVITIK